MKAEGKLARSVIGMNGESKSEDSGKRSVITGTITVPGRVRSEGIGTRVNLATPAYGGSYSSAYVRSLYRMMSSAGQLGIHLVMSEIDYADIVLSRNYLISNFFYHRTDCSHLLFVDNDMGFEPELIGEMLSLKEEVVGVICPNRRLDLRRLHASGDLPFDKAMAHSCGFIGRPAESHPSNPAFVRADSCGTGILLISRTCIEKMIQMLPDIVDEKRFRKMPFPRAFEKFLTPFNKIVLEDRELSEDLSFCRRWTKDCEGSIFANISRTIEHVGSLSVSSRYEDL